jgi:hypothetical protein
VTTERHEHRLGPRYCIHGTGKHGFLDYESFGRGSGPTYHFVSHKGPREACPDPDTIEGPIPACSRACPHTHQFDEGVCIICRVTVVTLAKETVEREKKEREADERRAVFLRKFRAEILEELRAVFVTHGAPVPPDAVLAGLIYVVEEHAGE